MASKLVISVPKDYVPIKYIDDIRPTGNHTYIAIKNLGEHVKCVYVLKYFHPCYVWVNIQVQSDPEKTYNFEKITNAIKSMSMEESVDVYECKGEYDFCILMGNLFG